MLSPSQIGRLAELVQKALKDNPEKRCITETRIDSPKKMEIQMLPWELALFKAVKQEAMLPDYRFLEKDPILEILVEYYGQDNSVVSVKTGVKG